MKEERSARLRRARELAGFASAAAAATRFRWSYPTYAAHENAGRGIDRAATKYAKAFKVSAAWLLTGEGDGPASGPPDPVLDELRAIYPQLDESLRDRLLEQARIYLRASAAPARDREE